MSDSEEEVAAEELRRLETHAHQRARLAIQVGSLFQEHSEDMVTFIFHRTCSPVAKEYALNNSATVELVIAAKGGRVPCARKRELLDDWKRMSDAERYFLEHRAIGLKTRQLCAKLRSFCHDLVDYHSFTSLFNGYGPAPFTGKSFAQSVFDDVLYPGIIDEIRDTDKFFSFEKSLGQRNE